MDYSKLKSYIRKSNTAGSFSGAPYTYNGILLLHYLPAAVLLLLPAMLGFTFMLFGVIYTGNLRPLVFEISWLLFAFVVFSTSIVSNSPVYKEAALFPRSSLIVFSLFSCIWVYTTIFVAPIPKLANYFFGIGIAALLVGLSVSALKRHFGNIIEICFGWAIFAAMLLHAPFWVWLYLLEGQNLEFNWLYRLPGYPGLRMYSYSVEAGIAAGLGLFSLTGSQNKQRRIWLAIGVSLLWMLLFWSGARGAFIALAATIIFVSIFIPRFAKTSWLFCISTITLGAGLSWLLPKPDSAYGILGRVDQILASTSLNQLSTNRLTVWSDAYKIFLERPFFGHGPAQYPYLTTNLDLTVHEQTHNILLESLVSFGIIGTIGLIYLLGKIWLTTLLHLKNTLSESAMPMFLVTTTLLAHGLVSGTFYHIHSVFMTAIAMGLLLQNANIEHPSK